MPPPEMKSISFERPSLLTLHEALDDSKVMIPTPLRKVLKELSGDAKVAIVFIPAFGYLYAATESSILEYDVNLLENAKIKFQLISKIGGSVEISQKGLGTLFTFGIYSAASMAQAKIVAKEMEGLLGYPIEEVNLSS